MPPSPSLTVRSFAELMEAPLYEYEEKLVLQKYPNRAPAMYRIPYYIRALATIRRFYRLNRQDAILQQGIVDTQASQLTPDKIAHNIRVIEAFRRSRQRQRNIAIEPVDTLETDLAGVTLKFTPDLQGAEAHGDRYILFNVRNAPVPPQVAKATLELAHWVLAENGLAAPPGALEYVDLFNGRVHRIGRVRPTTVGRARRNAQMVVQLWQNI